MTGNRTYMLSWELPDLWGGQKNVSDVPQLSRPTTGLSSSQAFLSLYLLLLAFMIMLQSFYTPDIERTSAVLTSVGTKFRQLPESARDPDTGLSPMAIEAGLQLSDNLGKVFEAYFPVTSADVRKDAETYSVDVPLDTLLLAEDPATIRPGKEGFLVRMAEVLSNAPNGIRFEMEVLVAPNLSYAQISERAYPTAVGLAKVAEGVEEAGVPPGGVAIGFAPIAADKARFFFTVTAPGVRSPRFDGTERRP